MTATFIKRGDPLQIDWEACGLSWLAAAPRGAEVVEIIARRPGELRTRRWSHVAPAGPAAEAFGRALAATHQAGASAFGVAPDGWDQSIPGWIGAARLPLGNYRSWGEFFAELRLLPHARAAVQSGSLTVAGMRLIERVCQRLRDGEFDDGRPPARIHGDLWAGNVIGSGDRYLLIDPAAHGGHPETDLAMLALFGHPQLRRITEAYAEAAQLAEDWRSRTALHQLHPLLVHAELFGAGYADRAVELASHYA